MSKATTALLLLHSLIRRSTSPLGAPFEPVPRRESIMQSAVAEASLSSLSDRSQEHFIVQFWSFSLISESRDIFASPLYASMSDDKMTVTPSPLLKKALAATKPSPPLFPGPARIRKLSASGYLFNTSRAAFVPAFSMSERDGTPYFSTARTSASLICSGS